MSDTPRLPDGKLFRRYQLLVKAILDRVGAAILLCLLSPLLAIIAAAIVIDSGFPILFRQERVGRQGHKFSIFKFRTMIPDASSVGLGLNVCRNDERISRVGTLLRTLSLDELPQLLNILSGEMSLIGPRPALPYQTERYTKRERRRLAVRPGITGWAQVNGRNRLSWRERIEKDLFYIEHFSLLLDMKILLKTAGAVLDRSGLYGEGGVNDDFLA